MINGTFTNEDEINKTVIEGNASYIRYIYIRAIDYQSKESIYSNRVYFIFDDASINLSQGNYTNNYDSKICSAGENCQLYEGETKSLAQDTQISLHFIDESQVRFNIQGTITDSLVVGDSYSFSIEETETTNESIDDNITISELFSCDNGCVYETEADKKCYPYGFIKKGQYCSADSGLFELQKESHEFCENSFECSSNLCVDRECVEAGFFSKMMSWFRNVFSWGKDKSCETNDDCKDNQYCNAETGVCEKLL